MRGYKRRGAGGVANPTTPFCPKNADAGQRDCGINLRGALLLACALAVSGCLANPQHSTSRPAAVEVMGARLSPDGTTVALLGGRVANPRGLGVWLVDAESGRTLSATPEGWICVRHRWGPGGSYVQTRRSPEGTWGLYWARSPLSASTKVDLGWISSAVVRPAELALDPKLQWVLMMTQWGDEGTQSYRARVISVPLSARGRIRTLWTADHYVYLLGVVSHPVRPSEDLVLVAGATEGGKHQAGVTAISWPSGKVRWQVGLAPRRVFFAQMAPYGPTECVVAANSEDPSTSRPSGNAWLLDLQSGQPKPFGSLPADARWLDVRQGPDGPAVFWGSLRSIWTLGGAPRRGGAKELIRGGKLSRAAGVRRNQMHGIDLYMTTEHCLWRYRASDRSLAPMWGAPGAEDQRPEVLSQNLGPMPGGQR